MEIKIFNQNSLLWDKKLFPILVTGYILLILICIIGGLLYFIDLHNNFEILIFIAIFPSILYGIIHLCKIILIIPNGDKDYLQNYYPEINKKLLWTKLFHIRKFTDIGKAFAWNYFIDGTYTVGIEDQIIDEMRNRYKKHKKLIISPLIIFTFLSIFLGMCYELK